MWLTKRQFEEEKIERELNLMACEYYRLKAISSREDPDKTRLLAVQVASERALSSLKKINETNPYKGLYFYAVAEDEGIRYFDKVIEYRSFRMVHYANVDFGLFGLYSWAFSFEFAWDNGERLRISGTFIKDFDLIKVMKFIDDYYIGKFFRYEDAKKAMKDAGAYIDE